jgi:hypothetical protein
MFEVRWIQVLVFICCALPSNNLLAQNHVLYESLVVHHAPVIFQKAGRNPKADAITRFDFDGDLIGNNNWKNLDTHPTPAFVYYDVRETETHYFVMYTFFHPRDYSFLCIPWICHENDMEGAMLIVEKNANPMGKLIAIQTMAHDRIYTHEKVGGIRPLAQGNEPDLLTKKVALYIQSGGHGVYVWDAILNKKSEEDKATVTYTTERLLAQVPISYAKDWLVFHHGDHSDDPNGAASGIFEYKLIPIWNELWERRHLIGQDHVFSTLFDFTGSRFELAAIPGTFAGEKWGSGRARPPWAWKHALGSGEIRGEWFLDPAHYAQKKMQDEPKNFSTQYLFNPYLQ